MPGWVTGPATARGADHVPPPFDEVETLPKNGLDEALSAQICSLSEKVVEDWCATSTGGIQAALPAAVLVEAIATSSVRETASASKPLNTSSDRVAPRFAARLA